jgi:hypothetical protein
MQVNPEEELAVIIEACLGELGCLEAAFIRECYLADPKPTFKDFAMQRGLSPKQLSELRTQVMSRLKEGLAAKNIQKIGDVT